MKATLGSCELGQLIAELTTRLTGLEKLGLLSGSGKSLKSLLTQVTDTPSTDGSALNQEDSGTFTYPRHSGYLGSVRDLWPLWPERHITCQSHGPTSLGATPAPMTRGSLLGITDAGHPANGVNW